MRYIRAFSYLDNGNHDDEPGRGKQQQHQKMSTTSSQNLSSALTVISANIEGLSAVKAPMLSDLCKGQHCHCLPPGNSQR